MNSGRARCFRLVEGRRQRDEGRRHGSTGRRRRDEGRRHGSTGRRRRNGGAVSPLPNPEKSICLRLRQLNP
ncbi:hypothetical protein EF294_15250 [Gordonia oryzae]|uniref:Uncharacterized protein n=1 Tax=Gordonia oryzae TaxID=2487349 RepID=A0A3N4G871_9ACTN|nr:hypothetical protein EF294_15250 [Gordonia oryzae]